MIIPESLKELQEKDLRKIFDNPDLHATMYISALDLLYPGMEYMDFEPETFVLEFESIKDNKKVLDKIFAGMTVRSNYLFWENHDVFEKVTVAFNDGIVAFSHQQLPSPGEMTWASIEAANIAGIPNDDVVFGHDVSVYISGILHDNGWHKAPDILGSVDQYLKKLKKSGVHRSISYEQIDIQKEKHDNVIDYINQNIQAIYEK